MFEFCFQDSASTEIDTYLHALALHAALPIWAAGSAPVSPGRARMARRCGLRSNTAPAAASRRRQTPHVAPTCARSTALSRAAPRPLRPGVPVRRDEIGRAHV